VNGFAAVALLLFVVIAGVACVFVIATGVPQTAFVDSTGNTTSAQANASRSIVQNGTAPVVGVVGSGLAIILVVVLIIILVAGILMAHKSTGYYSHSRYR
jgi:hypothetical protein